MSDERRRAANERLIKARLADPALSGLNEEQRRAVIVQEDRTLVVAGAGTGKTHTMVAKARDIVCTGISRASEIAFVTFTRKAAQEIRERSADLEGMEFGTLHHLACLVIARAEGKKPRLTPRATWQRRARRVNPKHLRALCRARRLGRMGGAAKLAFTSAHVVSLRVRSSPSPRRRLRAGRSGATPAGGGAKRAVRSPTAALPASRAAGRRTFTGCSRPTRATPWHSSRPTQALATLTIFVREFAPLAGPTRPGLAHRVDLHQKA